MRDYSKRVTAFLLVFLLLSGGLTVNAEFGAFNNDDDGQYGVIFSLQDYLEGITMPRVFALADSPVAPTHAASEVTVTARLGIGNRYLDVNRIIANNRTRGVRLRMDFQPGDIITAEGQLTGPQTVNFRFQPEPAPNTEMRDGNVTVLPGGRFVLSHTITSACNSGTAISAMRIVTEAVGATSFIVDEWTVYRPDPSVKPEGYIFHLQSYLSPLNLGNMGNGTENLAPTHSTNEVTVEIREGGPRHLFINRTLANSTRGLLLRDIDFEQGDLLTITGRLISGAGTAMRLQAAGQTGYMFGTVTNRDGVFTISYVISERLMGLANRGIRVVPHGAEVPAQFRVDNITIFRQDNTIPAIHMPNPAMTGEFTIESPYSGVNWNTHFQFRAAHHIHTTRSDGGIVLRDMVRDHYNRGFDIFAATDHNVICTGDWTRHPPAQPTMWWWQPMQWNNAAHLMTAEEQTAIRDGTWAPGAGRVLPASSRFTTAHGWIRPQMRGILGMPAGQNNVGMISIPNTNEQSGRHHMLTYWAEFNANEPWDNSDSFNNTYNTNIIRSVQDLGGLVVMSHPGRHTCHRASRCSASRDGAMCDHAGGRGLVQASNAVHEVTKYVNWLTQFSALVGLEIYNRGDHETRSDRILWDNILMQTMPQKRNVWGFSNDDSHSNDGTALGWNVMLMPSLTEENVRTSMENGAFYFVSRVDRRLDVNPNVSTSGSSSWHVPLMAAQAPAITNISVSGQVITVEGRNYDEIIWITGNPFRMNGNANQGGGVIIKTGNTLDLSEYGKYVWGNYVRAVLICRTPVPSTTINSHGVALTQPFGVYVGGTTPTLTFNPPSVTIDNTGLSRNVILGGTATGNISVSHNMPVSMQGNVSVNWSPSSSSISVTGVRPTANVPPITGSFNVSVTRQGVTQTFTVNVNLTTSYTPSYNVTFDLNGGRLVSGQSTQTVQHGGTATAPVVVRDGFLHSGWDTSLNNITAHTTARAQWLRLGAVSSGGNEGITSADVTWLARHIAGHAGFTLADPRLGNLGGYNRPPMTADLTLFLKWLVGYDLDYLISITPKEA
jgi:hypothetical protein